MKKLSIVIPTYNEEENVENAYDRILGILEKLPKYDYEIIFSDNDSSDQTVENLRKLASEDEKLKVIVNNRNFGLDASVFNAMSATSGDAVIWLNCDLQEPPEMIAKFVTLWEQGNLVIWGQKNASLENPFMYAIRRLYYKLIKVFADVPQYSHVIGIGLYDRRVLDEIRLLRDPNPILRNIVPNLGYKPVLVPYVQSVRKKGKSSYNFFRYFDYALNSLVHSTKAPMKIMLYTGIFCGVGSFLIGVFYFVYKLLYWDSFAMGMAPLIIFLSFTASVQMFFLGLIGEYLLAVLDRVSFTKHVVEKERINF